MKVLVADKFEKVGLDGLASLGCEVVCEPDLKDDALKARLAETGAAVLVVRSTKVTEAIMDGSQVKVIIRAGAGYDTIDLAAAGARGIRVANCPGKNSIAVAELAMGLIMAIDRKIPCNVSELKAGHWNKKSFSKGRGLCGSTLGLVGTGRIGQELIPRAKAFGMNVIAFSRWLTPEAASGLGIGRARSIEEVAERADIVSIHLSLGPSTKGIIGESFINKMKKGSYLINTSRSGVIDQEALAKALKSGHIFAGLDVFEGEPSIAEGPYEGPMTDMPNCYCTHHIGASTEQAQNAIAEEVVRIVDAFGKTGVVLNEVGGAKGNPTAFLTEVRHNEKPGVFDAIRATLKKDGVNIVEMEASFFHGCVALSQLGVDKAPSADCKKELLSIGDVYDVNVTPIDKIF